MRSQPIIFILIFFVFSLAVKAQNQSTIIHKKQIVTASNQSIVIDSLSIVPGSVSVFDVKSSPIDSSLYKIDFAKSTFLWLGKNDETISIYYRRLSFSLAHTFFNKDVKLLKELPIDNSNFYTYKPNIEPQTLFNVKGLNKNGSISRGIMFGNSQNLSVNSNMNLQLSGTIANDIEILAAISDDNLPIQPEGNTQQLNDFDKVFIQLKKDSTKLIAGDYEISKPEGYFMNFYKRTQGGMISHSFETANNWKYTTNVALAVAKGRSGRQTFTGQEGNQGPYRLQGNNGENYIILLAGTERVFIDGVPLLRGQENDYIINYNTAEITFTAKQMITQKSRINIEFEYSDKNYARTLTFFNQKVQTSKTTFRLNYYNEKDNKNQPFLQDLTDLQKQFMAGLDDNFKEAYYPNITEVEYNDNEILYEKLADIYGDTYYQYSVNPQLAKYRIGFSYVGAGKGNYKINNQAAANGKVYEYILPQGLNKQGDYEPITLLITPKQQQLITFGVDYKPQQNNLFGVELAYSNNDVNLFANQKSKLNKGYGFKLNFYQPIVLNNRKLSLNTSGSYEFVSATFKPLERYRSVEFNRDFNLDNLTLNPSNEHLWATSMQLYNDKNQQITYSLQILNRPGSLLANQHTLTGIYQYGKYTLDYNGSLMNNAGNLQNGNFYKQNIGLKRQIFNQTFAGVTFENQYNLNKNNPTDSLVGNSFSYQLFKVFIQQQQRKNNSYQLDFTYREDKLPKGKSLLSSSNAKGVHLTVDLNRNSNSTLNLVGGFQKTTYSTNFANTASNENVVGRINYMQQALKGLIKNDFYYEVGSGQEPKREITYLEVLPGQGIYAWNDYNANGVKELDEFELAQFPDQAKYIRIFTSSTEYVQTNFTGINHSLSVNPSALIKTDKGGMNNLLRRFFYQLNYKIDRKLMAGHGWMIYNPFYTAIDVANLVALNALIRNSLSFNRNNIKFGIDLNYLNDRGKSFLSSGFDSRKRNEVNIRIRTSPIRKTFINLNWIIGEKQLISELFSQKNFLINYLQLNPEFNYQLNNNFRVGFEIKYGTQKNNPIFGGEVNKNLNFSSEARYNILSKGVINAKLSFINNQFIGNTNSGIAYEMLAGLQNGSNYTWTLGLQRNISNGIQLNINYEGRKSASVRTIHTGNMQVRAYF